MVLDAVSNFVRGRADAQLTAGATTLSVDDASIFPDPATDGEFNVVMWDANNFPRPDQDGDVEVLRVTAVDTDTDTLTVARAQEGTSDVAHPEGSAVHLSPTAKMFSDIEGTFADFWDSGTQTLTADVDNGSVSTEDLESDTATIGQGSGDPSTFNGPVDVNDDLTVNSIPGTPPFPDGFERPIGEIENETVVIDDVVVSEDDPEIRVTEFFQYTPEVDSSTTILSHGGDGSLVHVWGIERDNGSIEGETQFLDLVRFHRGGNEVSTVDEDPQSGADGRSYNQSGDDLELSMDEHTYVVLAHARRGRVRL